MTEVSVETCFVNLRVLSFSLKFRIEDPIEKKRTVQDLYKDC